jgi:hypothetical protein
VLIVAKLFNSVPIVAVPLDALRLVLNVATPVTPRVEERVVAPATPRVEESVVAPATPRVEESVQAAVTPRVEERVTEPSTVRDPVLLTSVVERAKAEAILFPLVMFWIVLPIEFKDSTFNSCAKLSDMFCVPKVAI